MAIGFDLEGRLAASTSSEAARHQMKRERVLRNMLTALNLSIQCVPFEDGLYNSSATEAMAEDRYGN